MGRRVHLGYHDTVLFSDGRIPMTNRGSPLAFQMAKL
jgi:hypothetical protein